MSGFDARIKELNLTLPAAPSPMANYVTARRVGNLLFFSGAGPFQDGKPVVFGEAGKHSRTAVAVPQLPFNIPIEVELIVEAKEG